MSGFSKIRQFLLPDIFFYSIHLSKFPTLNLTFLKRNPLRFLFTVLDELAFEIRFFAIPENFGDMLNYWKTKPIPQEKLIQRMQDSEEFLSINDDLIQRAKSGDEKALAELFGILKPRLHRVISTRMSPMLRGRVDPSDILQEAYLDLAKRLPAFDQKGISMFVWMRMVANESLVNAHRIHVNTQKRGAGREVSLRAQNPCESSICLAGHLMAQHTSVSNVVLRNELQASLMEAIDQINEVDREIILMRIFEGLSNSEAAETLGLSANGASNRFVRAIGRLKSLLESTPGFTDAVDF